MFHISSDADIERIGRGLIDRSLPKAEWTHAAHFAAAFWLLRDPERDALRDMPGFIRAGNEATRYAEHRHGRLSRDHHARVAAGRARVADSATAFELSMPRSKMTLIASPFGSFSDWLLSYWSRPVLSSVTARRTWVET